MGEAAEAASDGGAYPGDGGAGDARAVRRRGRAARSPAQHTTAGWRVRTRRTFTVTSPLSGELDTPHDNSIKCIAGAKLLFRPLYIIIYIIY